MSTRTEASDLIRALARRDWDTAERLTVELDRVGWVGAPLVIGAAFGIVVNRHFGSRATPNEVARFVADIRSQYQDGGGLPALELEGLVRGVLGEPELLEHMAPDVMVSGQMFIVGKLLQDTDLTEAQLQSFITEVEQTAARYM